MGIPLVETEILSGYDHHNTIQVGLIVVKKSPTHQRWGNEGLNSSCSAKPANFDLLSVPAALLVLLIPKILPTRPKNGSMAMQTGQEQESKPRHSSHPLPYPFPSPAANGHLGLIVKKLITIWTV